MKHVILLSSLLLVSMCRLLTAQPLDRPEGTIPGPTGRHVAYSRDGARLLLAGAGGARVWDAKSFEPIGPAISAEDGKEFAAAAINSDGTCLLVAAGNEVRLANASTGKTIHSLRHDDAVRSAMFSADGLRVLSTSDDRTARVWSVSTGRQIISLVHEQPVRWGTFSAGGKRIFTAQSETNEQIRAFVPWRGVGRLWDAISGEEIKLGARNRVMSDAAVNFPGLRSTRPVAFRPDGHAVAVAFAGAIAIYDTVSGELADFIDIAEVAGTSVAIEYSPDGKRIVATTGTGFVRVWDVVGNHLTTPKFGGDVIDARFGEDPDTIITAGAAGQSGVWDASSGRQVLSIRSPRRDEIPMIAVSPAGDRFVTAFEVAGETHVYSVPDVRDARPAVAVDPVWKPARRLAGPSGVAASFSRDGKRFLSAGDRAAQVWNPQTGQPVTDPLDHGEGIAHASLSDDGAKAFIAGGTVARVWDVERGVMLYAVDHQGVVRSGGFSPDGARVVTAANGERTVRVRDAATGKVVLSIEQPATAYYAAYTPDGGKLLTLVMKSPKDRGLAIVWDAASGAELRRRNIDDWVHQEGDDWTRTAAISPDGKKAASIAFRDVVVWDIDTGQTLVAMDVIDASGGTHAMVFSTSGDRLLTYGGPLCLWDTGREELLAKIDLYGIRNAVLHPDGKSVLAGGDMRNTGIYDLSTGRLIVEVPDAPLIHEAPAVAMTTDGRTFSVSRGNRATEIWQVLGAGK